MSSSLILTVLGWMAALSSPIPPPFSCPAAPSGSELGPQDHDALSGSIHALADAHPELARVEPVGQSRGGRSIEALRITAAEDPSAVPGILLVANLEGPRVFESEVALDHARRLLEGYADSERVRALLDTTVVWILPRANPDAAEARFQEPRFERWATGSGFDNDRDGRLGEDPPSDVNGDGFITKMRVLDPDGEWIPDPTDARILVKADPAEGEHGRYKVYVESRDLDGDEAYGEDAAADAEVDRNFPAGWEEGEVRAGVFATDEPEARALCEFVLARTNLALVVIYDGMGNLVKERKSVADDAKSKMRIPPAGVLESDAEYLAELGERYRDATGNETEGSAEDGGTFGRWCYEQRGLFVLATDLWELPFGDVKKPETEEGSEPEDANAAKEEPGEKDEAEAKPSDEAKRLLWVDAEAESWRFLPWTPFDHPELGPVEIGGFAPFALVEPPAETGSTIAAKHFDWFLSLGELAPRLSIVECEKERVGMSLWRVTAVVGNSGYLPLLSRSARRTRTTRPARVLLVLPEAAGLIAGRKQALLEDLDGSGGRHEFTWLVKGPEGMEIGVSIDSDHAGSAVRQAEEKQ